MTMDAIHPLTVFYLAAIVVLVLSVLMSIFGGRR